jgi:hypothetical protein
MPLEYNDTRDYRKAAPIRGLTDLIYKIRRNLYFYNIRVSDSSFPTATIALTN